MSPSTLPRRAGDLVFGGHLVLALAMIFWRAFESLPGLSAADGGGFTSSRTGRLLALATLIVAGLAGLAVCLQTGKRWRDPRFALLGSLLVLALATRTRADLFDLVYAGLALAFAAWWFRSERALVQEST